MKIGQETRLLLPSASQTHLVVEIQALEAGHGLGELRQLGDRLHRGALAAVEEPGFSLLLPEQAAAQRWNHGSQVQAVLGRPHAAAAATTVVTHHVSGQGLLRPLERFHVVDDEGLLGEKKVLLV